MNSMQLNKLAFAKMRYEDERVAVLRECGWKKTQDRPTTPGYWEETDEKGRRWTAPNPDAAIDLEKFPLDLGSLG